MDNEKKNNDKKNGFTPSRQGIGKDIGGVGRYPESE